VKVNDRIHGDLEKERLKVFEAVKGALLSSAESIEIAEKNEGAIDWDFENEKLSLENRREKRELRRRWNKVLMCLVISGFILSYLLIILIGFGVMSFDNNAFAVPSVVAAGIVETYGLARLAIEYFFSEDGDKRKKRLKS